MKGAQKIGHTKQPDIKTTSQQTKLITSKTPNIHLHSQTEYKRIVFIHLQRRQYNIETKHKIYI